MKADTSRSTFKQTKHYSGVLMQQGRVQLDADWNEQIDITGHRIETETIDVIGNCGAPMHDAGFHIVANANDLTAEEKKLPENQNPPAIAANDLLISGGRYYVDGILCENDSIVAYTKQPDLPNLTVVNQAGTYLAYLDVWSRHMTALEDPSIREVALGGPDTATRSKTIWQVKLFRVGDANLNANCATIFQSWNDEIAAGTGKLAAQAATTAPSNDPCIVAPGAGYRRLENQHYRVEVHDKGALGTATFKLSRDNGSIVTKWESQAVNDLTVGNAGRDDVLRFAAGNWVELSDDTNDLLSIPGTLVQLAKVEGNVLTINPASAIPAGPINIANFPRNPKVRRWDMTALIKPNNQNWLDLEDGVQVQFTNGTYKTGDYWLIPARTATADVEWPVDPNTNQPATQLPVGIKHHFCRLAILEFASGAWTKLSDCRNLFPPITELTNFFYLSGDGQEATPDPAQPNALLALAQLLRVGVANGEWPVAGASVEFKILQGNGRLQGAAPPTIILTGADGVAACTWEVDSTTASQQVEARLMDALGNTMHLPVRFNANLSTATEVSYDPKQCGSLKDQNTVQKALDQLSALGSLYEVSGNGQTIGENETLNPLVVIAANKCGPIAGTKVEFKLISAEGSITPKNGGTTDADGLASCDWTLGPSFSTQEVEATLQADQTHPTIPPTKVRFTAQRRATDGVHPGIHITDAMLLASGKSLPNDSTVVFDELTKGIRIVCDEDVAQETIDRPTCFVALELPFPVTTADRDFWKPEGLPLMGFQPLILLADVSCDNNAIFWTPRNFDWMSKLFDMMKEFKLGDRVLARLTLKGNFIWSAKDSTLFLDGEAFGAPPGKTPTNLLLASGDGQRGGDFEMWFWLVAPTKRKEKEKEKEKEKDKEIKEKDLIDKVKDREVKGGEAKAPDVKVADVPHGAGPRARRRKAARPSAAKKKPKSRAFIRPDERPKVAPAQSRKPKRR